MDKNLKAFLDTIGVSEGTSTSPITRDGGYDVIVSGIDDQGKLVREIFTDYSTHPFSNKRRPAKPINRFGLFSTASGKYQLLERYYGPYCMMLGLSDFTPDSQDRIAVQQIKERHALDDVLTGHFQVAIAKCSSIWASLPGAGYNQHENKMDVLEAAFERAGGTFA